MGKRLKALTQDNTKCMVKVNGVTLIERMLRQLDSVGLNQIVVVVGYESQKLIDYISTLSIETPIEYVHNDVYDQTNNIYSLALAADHLVADDTILLESDLIFEDAVLEELLDDRRDTLALVDRYQPWMDGTVTKISEDGEIKAFVGGKELRYDKTSNYFKTVNIYKFSQHFSESHYVPFLRAFTAALGRNEYYEQVLRVLTVLDDPGIQAKPLNGELWYEIDDAQDLDIASSMFHPDAEDRLTLLQNRYGGYWRYPKLVDFCYLVNPYYPPTRMMDEMRASFETLLTQYPSGMAVNSLLAAKMFGIRADQIVVGNGAAELIKSLMDHLPGPVGITRPTFEEYPNRTTAENLVTFIPSNVDYSYTATDLIDFFGNEEIGSLLLINPDNPSGNYLPNAQVLELIEWAGSRGITVVVDESFVDFADEENATLLREEFLDAHPELVVVKSISKSYGVPGLRLGVLANSDRELLSAIRADTAIWNINSFAEFYLQIEEKYHSSYVEALKRLRDARRVLSENLSAIPGVRVVPSQANYLMLELTGQIKSHELARQLLEKNLLIKDLGDKTNTNGHQYVRVAVRNKLDNKRLVKALRHAMSVGQG